MATPEGNFKSKLVKDLKELYPKSVVTKLEADLKNGIPDIVILHESGRWATLEAKASKEDVDKSRPNKRAQNYYVGKMRKQGYSSYIYPENKKEVLDELKDYFK